MSTPTPFLVQLGTIGASRGRGTAVAEIPDARDIGISEYANQAGECFFTLPATHPLINECVPLQRHVRVLRWSGTNYVPIWSGLLDDYEARANEVVFFGTDYLGLLTGTITSSNTSYTGTFLGNIIQAQITAARAEANSRVAFIGTGTIAATTTTATLLTSFQPRLDFIGSVIDVLIADRSVRPIISVTPRTAAFGGVFEFQFSENQGSDKEDVRLEYGGLVRDFVYAPGYNSLATRIYGVGVKREGATVLYSTQTYANEATYGWIARPELYQDVIDQTSLDQRVKRDARRAARVGKNVALSLRASGLAPWDGYDLGDAVRVVINRGIVSVNQLYTVWGLEWIGQQNGSEELFLSLTPKET